MIRPAGVEGGKFLLHISQSGEPGRASWSREKRSQCHMPSERYDKPLKEEPSQGTPTFSLVGILGVIPPCRRPRPHSVKIPEH